MAVAALADLMEIFYASLAMFLFVGLKAFQQRNVGGLHYWPIVPISVLMVASEAYVIVAIASRGWDLVFILVVGSAAGLGSIIAMYLHTRIFRRGIRQ